MYCFESRRRNHISGLFCKNGKIWRHWTSVCTWHRWAGTEQQLPVWVMAATAPITPYCLALCLSPVHSPCTGGFCTVVPVPDCTRRVCVVSPNFSPPDFSPPLQPCSPAWSRCSSLRTTWEFLGTQNLGPCRRPAEIRICILARSPEDSCAHKVGAGLV